MRWWRRWRWNHGYDFNDLWINVNHVWFDVYDLRKHLHNLWIHVNDIRFHVNDVRVNLNHVGIDFYDLRINLGRHGSVTGRSNHLLVGLLEQRRAIANGCSRWHEQSSVCLLLGRHY